MSLVSAHCPAFKNKNTVYDISEAGPIRELFSISQPSLDIFLCIQ
jgi:hypothetical protein